MRTERRDNFPERMVLVGMIVSKQVLGPIADRWQHGLFASKWANLIGSWCVAHYRKYRKPPGSAIEHYFTEWANTGTRERETVEAIEMLLIGLSNEVTRLKQTVSPDYILDVAAQLFEKIHLKDLAQKVEACLERNELDKARQLVQNSRKIEIGLGSGIDVLTDVSALESAFEQQREPLITLPGGLRSFYGNALSRNSFVSFLAKEKGGKSFILQDLVWRAVEQQRNVAYFEMGDHSQAEVMIRFATRATGRPYDEEDDTKRIELPTSLDSNGDIDPIVESHWESVKTLDLKAARRVFDELAETGRKDRLKLSCHPAGTLSVSGAETILDRWLQDGWVPDAVVFDYADITAPTDRTADKLEQIGDTWMAMRAISQRLHCLVLTATQCNREGFDVRVLTREHVGGYHMKLAHVTLMVGINQGRKEKEKGLSRLNAVAGRNLEFAESKCLWCAGCLAIGQPAILSTF